MAKMLFMITNGFEKAGRAARAFQFAKVACEKGNEVKVFLLEDGIQWGRPGMADEVRTSTGDAMKPFIDYLLGHGAQIFACKA